MNRLILLTALVLLTLGCIEGGQQAGTTATVQTIQPPATQEPADANPDEIQLPFIEENSTTEIGEMI